MPRRRAREEPAHRDQPRGPGPAEIRKALLLKLFDAAYMQRWNDKIRPWI
jgi:hypothetical protein